MQLICGFIERGLDSNYKQFKVEAFDLFYISQDLLNKYFRQEIRRLEDQDSSTFEFAKDEQDGMAF